MHGRVVRQVASWGKQALSSGRIRGTHRPDSTRFSAADSFGPDVAPEMVQAREWERQWHDSRAMETTMVRRLRALGRNARPPTTHHRRPGLTPLCPEVDMACRHVQFAISIAALFLASACMGTAADVAASDEASPSAIVEPDSNRIALRTGASVGPDEIDGFCENGAGVYLSADDTSAQLMVYVVTPAETVTFDRPELTLTTEQGDTQTFQFETVTLRAGESWTFAEKVDAKLVDVVAEVAAE